MYRGFSPQDKATMHLRKLLLATFPRRQRKDKDGDEEPPRSRLPAKSEGKTFAALELEKQENSRKKMTFGVPLFAFVFACSAAFSAFNGLENVPGRTVGQVETMAGSGRST